MNINRINNNSEMGEGGADHFKEGGYWATPDHN